MSNPLPFKLLHKGLCLVEPVFLSGTTDSGIYVIDQETQFAKETTMLVRVLGIHPENNHPSVLGEVCIVPTNAWEKMHHDGVEYCILNEKNIQAIFEGYDGEDSGYPVCGKA